MSAVIDNINSTIIQVVVARYCHSLGLFAEVCWQECFSIISLQELRPLSSAPSAPYAVVLNGLGECNVCV